MSLTLVTPTPAAPRRDRAFGWMLAAAIAVHALAFGIAEWMPDHRVQSIPVHALTFKLGGDAPRVTAAEPSVAPMTPALEKLATPVKKPIAPPVTPAIAPMPQQYIREVGAAPQAPADAAASEAIRARYEQEISGWIQRHKFYPADAAGREGRVIVRMRIDRAGNVRYYAVEQSSGLTMLDAAALDMIARANPVPAVPADYPAGNLVEFLIPITFKAPI